MSCERIAALSGVPLGTVQKVFSGVTRNPRYQTLSALNKAFTEKAGKSGPGCAPQNVRNYTYCTETSGTKPLLSHAAEQEHSYQTDGSSALAGTPGNNPGENSEAVGDRNSKHHYDRQGQYTLKDYLALPDDQRVELIDGVFYDMSAPLTLHQTISFTIATALARFIDDNNGSCEVFEAPVDVQLDCDERTIVEPDVCIVCDPEKITRERIVGAPDFVVEVLSPSTRKKDQTLKLWKYANAGVREYWMVDPDSLQISVFDFEHDGRIRLYGFHDQVPVGIYQGKVKVDFERAWKKISRFYGSGEQK